MDNHSYRNVHDENKHKKKLLVIRAEMCMTKTNTQRMKIDVRTEMYKTKTNTQRNGSHSYKNVHDENP